MHVSPRMFLTVLSTLIVAAVAAAVIASSGSASPQDPQPPTNATRPTITGLQVGQTLTASPGTWNGQSPISYYVDWHRSNGTGWDTIAGTGGSLTYTVTAADIGHNLLIQTKATNSDGVQWMNSYATSVVSGPTVANTVALPDGKTSVLIDNVVLPDRLVVDSATFTPASLKPGGTVTAKVTVLDTAGDPVRGALVQIVGLPFGSIAQPAETPTGTDGTISFTLTGTAQLAHTPGGAIALSIRARKPGESPLAGVTAQRLVELKIGS